MPRQIIKPDRDVDFYVEWSSIVEAPTAFGPREWMLDHLLFDYRRATHRFDWEREQAEQRLARADVTGSSAYPPFACTWDDEGEIYEQRGILPRAKIRELCERLSKDERADVSDLLEPFDDDVPVQSGGGGKGQG